MTEQQSQDRIPLESWEVGGELLDILSRGLYSNAKDAIREYVQNGVDAGASNVHITVRGPRVTVRDDGEGMDWETLRRARRFGASDKNAKENVGFRGIGMYSAFGMCESMQIMTRQRDADELLRLEIEFGEMRRTLERDRDSVERSEIGLTDLLYAHTHFTREPDSSGGHFTIVRLDGMIQEYRAQLHDLSSLSTYLLNTLPVAFPDHGYGTQVNEQLEESVGLNTIRLLLRVDNEPEFPITPQLAEDVDVPKFHWIRDEEGKAIAFVWHALSTRGRRIPSRSADEDSGVSGYLLKMKGFTLGDRVRLKPLWPAVGGRTLYHHYTGEVHLMENAEVHPNAARDNLEPSVSKQAFEKHLEEYFYELNQRASIEQDILKNERRLRGFQVPLGNLHGRAGKTDEDPFELYRESKNLLGDLDNIERSITRLNRGRSGRGRQLIEPSTEQRRRIRQSSDELDGLQTTTRNIVETTAQQTMDGSRPSQRSAPQVPPQIALLERASEAVRAAYELVGSVELQRAEHGLTEARKARSVARAVAVLDELKANGTDFPDTVESSRKELRTFLGRSPSAPVSLMEALNESGFLTATDREQELVQAIDNGILLGIGSRGERYEAVIRAVSESVSDEDDLQ